MDSITLSKFKSMFEGEKLRLITTFGMASESFSLNQDEKYDEADLTSHERDSSMRMRLKNREALYLKKINEAIRRITEGTFGECEECGDEIEMKRLEVRPTATHCLGCKEEQERREMIHIDGHKHKSVGSKLRLA